MSNVEAKSSRLRPLVTNLIQNVTKCWPWFQEGDSNLVDALHLGEAIGKLPGLNLSSAFPSKDRGVELVECVDAHLIGGCLIRALSATELARRLRATVRAIRAKASWSAFEPAAALSVGLHSWHGCISMAKSLRPEDSRGRPYTHSIRMHSYSFLLKQIEGAGPAEQEWITYGMSLAWTLEATRGNKVMDDWVPKDSPYWR